MRIPDPKANTTTEAYLAYKAGFLEAAELKPSLYEPYLHFDAWLAYWCGLTDEYPKDENGNPETLSDEEALVAYLADVTSTFPETPKDPYDVRVASYLRRLIHDRYACPEYPVTNEEFYLSAMASGIISGALPLTITGASNDPLEDYKIYGNSEKTASGVLGVGDKTVNLFDKNSSDYIGAYIDADGQLLTNGTCRTYIVKVTPNTEYTFTYDNSGIGVNSRCVVCGFANRPTIGSSGETYYRAVGDSSGKWHIATFITGNNTQYLALWLIHNTATDSLGTAQLQLGDTVTAYEPYGYKIPVETTVFLPDEYQQVEYLQSSGSGQFIDTGVVPTGQGFVLETRVRYDSWYRYSGIYGNYVGENVETVRLILTGADNDKGYISNMARAGSSATIDFPKGVVNTVVSAYSYAIVNGARVKIGAVAGDSNNTSVALFNFKTDGRADYIDVAIYHQKIWNNGRLIRQFVPCYRKADNKPGLYDTVSDTFFPNAGPEEFTLGDEVTNGFTSTENIYLNEPLRKINDYADYVDYANGKVVRVIGSKKGITFPSGSYSSASKSFLVPLDSMPDTVAGDNVPNIGSLSNKFDGMVECTYNTISSKTYACMPYVATGNAPRAVFRFDDSVTTPSAANSIVGDDLDFYYPLATPTEEAVQLPEILLCKGTNIIDVKTEVAPSNMTVAFHREWR